MYRSFFENNLDALILTNDNGDIFAANKAACGLLKTTEKEIIARGRSGVVDLSDHRLQSILKKRSEQGLVKERLRLKRGDHSTFEGEITTTVFTDDNGQKRTIITVRDVTGQFENEQKLHNSKRQNEILISNLPGMVYRCLFDKKWTFIYVSEGSKLITGYPPEYFLSNPDVSYAKLILQKYRDEIWDKWNEVVNQKSTFEAEYQITDSNGRLKWVWERGRPVFKENGQVEYLEGYIEDITERKNTERDLIKFTRAVEQNMSSIVLTDINGNIEYANQSFFDISGFTRDEAVGQNMRLLKSGLVAAEVYKNMWETILNGSTWRGELINKKKNGEMFWVNKSISPILDSRGKISNFVSVAENITKRKKAEEELIEAKERAEEVDRLKTAFLANMSHELRTPLNAVIGFSELIDQNMAKEQILEFSEIINQSGNHLLEIVEQIFDVSLLETGNLSISFKDIDLVRLFGELAHEVKKKLSKHGKEHLSVDVKLPEGVQEFIVHTDRKRFHQVLLNLLDNAIKFTKKGGVQYGFEPGNGEVLFWVKDTGIGISEEKQRMIFHMFNQVEQSYTRETGGPGIGLTVSQKLIELLGGKMWLESDPEGTSGEKGSTFYFSIPINERK
ncbi:MAG: PAS domain S-box protein [Prolixibacteraceae bacterium]|nr:PAS domain S-box protein [Prolixibacteraceae bacterium]